MGAFSIKLYSFTVNVIYFDLVFPHKLKTFCNFHVHLVINYEEKSLCNIASIPTENYLSRLLISSLWIQKIANKQQQEEEKVKKHCK